MKKTFKLSSIPGGHISPGHLEERIFTLLGVTINGITEDESNDQLVIDFAEPITDTQYNDVIAIVMNRGNIDGMRDAKGSPVVSQLPYAYSSEDGFFLGSTNPYLAVASGLSFFDEPVGPKTIFVQGGFGWTTAANIGDYIEFSVVDKDGVIPDPTGTFPTLMELYGLAPGVDALEVNKFVARLRPPPWDAELDATARTAGQVLSGLYLRLAYNNVGPNDVHLAITYTTYKEKN